MSLYLGYTYSTGLSKDEIVVIDKQVCKNWELVYIFIKKLPLNAKRKAKRLCLYVMFTFAIWQPLSCTTIVLPLTLSSPSIERIKINKPNSQFKNFLKIAPTFIGNSDKIVLTNKQIKQFDLFGQQIIHGFITIDEEILQLRGGN